MDDLRYLKAPAPSASSYEGWGQRVGGFASLPALIRELGADPVALLARVGIAPEAIADPERQIPYQALVALLREGALKTACPHLGLLAGQMWHLADLGVVGEAVRHSPSVGRALQTLTAYHHPSSEGGLPFLIERETSADLGYAICHPAVVGADQLYDAALAACMNFMRQLCGPGWMPSEVFLLYAKPDNVAHHRRLFKVLPHFNASFCALRFPVQQLDMPVVGADPERWRAALQRLLAQHQRRLLPQVYRVARRLLLDERHSGDDIAHMLSMHRRTLNRRLQARGTSLQAVLDHVRFQMARELLASDITLDDIAAILGYSAVTPFMRTFRRWSGTTPGRWRRSVRGESGKAILDLLGHPRFIGEASTYSVATRSTRRMDNHLASHGKHEGLLVTTPE